MNPPPESGRGACVAEGEHLDVELVTSAFAGASTGGWPAVAEVSL